MYSGDIWIDSNGNTIIDNNDIATTTDDRSFIINMLKTTPGSWRTYPSLGVGLDEFIGESNTIPNQNKMKVKIMTFFDSIGFLSSANIFAFDNTSVVCYLLFSGLIGNQINLGVTFNLDSGALDSIETYDSDIKVQGTPVAVSYKNKYLKRGNL